MKWCVAVVFIVAACSRSKAPAPDDRMNASSLGALDFKLTEGTPAARAHFTRGLLALHSFWYDEAQREFEAAIAADRTMNMAYWGLAMSHVKLLWGEDDVVAARAALRRMPDPDRLSARDAAWSLAAIELLKADDVASSRKVFARAMTEVHQQFRDDESATFLAIALLSSTRPDDLDHLVKRQRAAELARSVYERNPKHPGAAHYMIHALDTPAAAKDALPQAQAYAQIAPEAFHARHMPAHIFARLGMWRDAIASCESAWAASLAAAKRTKRSANHHDFHSLSWLVELPFELGQRTVGERWLNAFGAAVRAGLAPQHRALYAATVGAYLHRSGEWTRVDELLAPLSAPAVDEAVSGQCGTRGPSSSSFEQLAVLDVRLRAAAARRDRALVDRLAGEIDALRASLRPMLAATQSEAALARIDAANERARRSVLARAAGDDAALLEALRASVGDADLELAGETNASGYSIRDDIGDALLRLGKPADAAAAYEQSLERQPNRARALLGAARAHTAAGNPAAAQRFYRDLASLWANAEPSTPALDEARAAR